MFYATIGSVSTGTLLPRDLADSFYFDLSNLARRDDDAERKARTLAALAEVQPLLQRENDEDLSSIETFVNETAFELFDAYCAPYTHFGTHPGDGSDFGIWPDVESACEAARYEDGIVKVDAGDEWPELGADISYVLEVNDHGNVTLYDAGSRRELWACV